MSHSFAERLFASLTTAPEKPAIVFEGRAWTFADLDRLSSAYARGLSAAGIGRGDRVAVFAETSPEVIVALLGHYRLGAVHVPVNTRYRGEEVTHILDDSGAKALLLRAGSPCASILEELPPPALAFRIWIGSGDATPVRETSPSTGSSRRLRFAVTAPRLRPTKTRRFSCTRRGRRERARGSSSPSAPSWRTRKR
jgi:acyl-CoA synthetase (AMP-forming)/AMP-acid ligase II